jgi:hypothetical protein
MGQSRHEITQHLAERWCWDVPHRDDSRVARRLHRKPLVDGAYRRDEGALLADFCDFPQELGVVNLMHHVREKAVQREWNLGHPPKKTARAVRVHIVFTLLMFALATAYRWQCEQEAVGGTPVGWKRRRRQLLEETRDKLIIFAEGAYGIFHIALYPMPLRAKLKDVRQGIGTWQAVLVKYGITTHG